MSKKGTVNFRISEELEAKMDKEINRLGTDKTKWLISVIQKALEEKIVIQRGGKEELVDNPVKVTAADIQRQLDELYKRKKVLGNGIEMPGTYLDLGKEKGDILKKSI